MKNSVPWKTLAVGLAFWACVPASTAPAWDFGKAGEFLGIGNGTSLEEAGADWLKQAGNSTAIEYVKGSMDMVQSGSMFQAGSEALLESILSSGLTDTMASFLEGDPKASAKEQAASLARKVADGSFARKSLSLLDDVMIKIPGVNNSLEARIWQERALEFIGAHVLQTQREKIKGYAEIGRYAAYAAGMQSLGGLAITYATGSAADIEKALADGANPQRMPEAAEGSLTPLHLAARYNKNPGAVRILTQAGADVNARDQYGETPLHKVMLNINNTAVIAVLAEAGADFNAKNNMGETALDAMIGHAFLYDKRSVAALIKAQAARHASVEAAGQAKAPQENPFTRALFTHLEEPLFADVDTVAALINAGADVNALSPEGDRLLVSVLRTFAPKEVVEKLLDEGADPCLKNAREETVLHSLAEHASLNGTWLRHLLPPHKADRPYPALDVDAKDERGETALGLAVTKGFWGDCLTLVDAGADMNLEVPPGQTPLARLLGEAKTPDDKSRQLLALLVERFAAAGAELDKKGADGKTARELISPEVRNFMSEND